MGETKTQIRDMRIYQATSSLSRPIADATHDISKRLLFMFWKWKQKEASWGKGIS